MGMLVIEDKVAIYINSNHSNFLFLVVYGNVLSMNTHQQEQGQEEEETKNSSVSSTISLKPRVVV